MRSPRAVLASALLAAAAACGEVGPPPVTLGPADGHDLPAADLARVEAGDPAPDFTLAAYEGDPVTLSDFRGKQDVILVFYRGHW